MGISLVVFFIKFTLWLLVISFFLFFKRKNKNVEVVLSILNDKVGGHWISILDQPKYLVAIPFGILLMGTFLRDSSWNISDLHYALKQFVPKILVLFCTVSALVYLYRLRFHSVNHFEVDHLKLDLSDQAGTDVIIC
ncbi:hypothetical protein OAB57_01610 [Bacteriovoracaceae bacterium]|nr:hypothetical protein [Bacteriovoracaceae bacterium]